jgi:hypothetical protein
MHDVSEQGVGEDFQLSPSGDYCNYYRLGEGLNTTNANKQSSYTGYEPPSPLASYQEGNFKITPPNVCQAYETFWGHVLQGSGNSNCTARPPCGMQHYVSLHEQGGSDRPWSSSFGEPSLVVSADVLPFTLGTHGGAWGYLCPLFEDQTSGEIIEYCLEQWRVGSGFPSTNEHFDVVSACASGGNPAHVIDQIITQFAPGTLFAENLGPEKTFVFGSNGTWRAFSARITRANLENAINRDNTLKNEYEGYNHGGCSVPEHPRSFSTNPANYALIGIEHGVEGGTLSELGGSEANLQLWTEYTPQPPTVSTSLATSVQEEQATLNGSVNPNATDTHYYFQYGTSTGYGSSSPEIDGGSGTSTVPVSVPVTNLMSDIKYHYRIVATNSAGTSYGADQTFRTLYSGASTWTVREPVSGNQWAYYRGSDGAVWEAFSSNGLTWTNTYVGGRVAAGTIPSVIRDPATGKQWVFYNGTNAIYNWEFNGEKWVNGGLPGTAPAAGTSPSATRDPATGKRWVFYNGTNAIYNTEFNGEKWVNGGLAGVVPASGTSPSAVRDPATGKQWVFYDVINGLYNWEFNGEKWVNGGIPGKLPANQVPAAVEDPSSGEVWVDYYGASFAIWQSHWNGSSWSNTNVAEGKERPPSSSTWTVREPVSGNQWAYYRGSDGAVWEAFSTNGLTWTNKRLGGQVAVGTVPTVVRDVNTGKQWVFYNGTTAIYNWEWNGEKWVNGPLPGTTLAAGTSPSATRDPASGKLWVFWNGSNLYVTENNGKEWVNSGLAGVAMASGTSPSAVRDPATSRQWAFYNAGSALYNWEFNGTKWVNGGLPGAAPTSGTSPSATRESGGKIWVFYNGINAIFNTEWNGKEWINGGLAGAVPAAGASPDAVRDPETGKQWVFYDTTNALYNWEWNGSKWVNGGIPGKPPANQVPAAVEDPSSGEVWVDYYGASFAIWQSHWNGSSWSNGEI